MDEILGTSKNVTGRGLLTIHTNQICDLFVVAGVVPPVTYTLRIENGVVRVSGMSRPLHLLKIWMIISQRMDMTGDTTDSMEQLLLEIRFMGRYYFLGMNQNL